MNSCPRLSIRSLSSALTAFAAPVRVTDASMAPGMCASFAARGCGRAWELRKALCLLSLAIWFIIPACLKGQQAPLECPANSVPVGMRQTGMRGAWNGARYEAFTGADLEPAAAD